MWRTDIESWEKISKDTIDFYFDIAGSRLVETVKTSESITKKTHLVLIGILGLSTSLMGYIVSLKCVTDFAIVAVVAIFIFLGLLFWLAKNLFPYKIGTIGEEPIVILKSKYIDNDFNEHEQYVNLKLQICEAYQEKITKNKITNLIRQIRVEKVIWALIILPFLLFLVFVVVHFS